MELDLTCVGSFVVLAQERHFGRASQVLHVTPSALTKRLQRLEQQLGVSLIERGPSGVFGITSAGERFVPEARSLIEHARSVAERFRARHAGVHGVRLGVPGAVGDFPAIDILRNIRQALSGSHPTVPLSVTGIPYGSDSNALVNRHVDVMLTVCELASASVDSVPLAPLIRVGAVPFWHEMADAKSVPVEAFAELPILRHPGAPVNLLNVFCLGDVRSLGDAQLIHPDGGKWSPGSVEEYALRTGTASVCPEHFRPRLDPRMRRLDLIGVPPGSISAAFRRSDNGEPTHALIGATRAALTDS